MLRQESQKSEKSGAWTSPKLDSHPVGTSKHLVSIDYSSFRALKRTDLVFVMRTRSSSRALLLHVDILGNPYTLPVS